MSSSSENRIYVGNLPPDVRNRDIEDLFSKYGKIVRVDLKNSRGPPFCFIQYHNYRDSQDAIHARDGYNYDGYRLRVEFPKTNQRRFEDSLDFPRSYRNFARPGGSSSNGGPPSHKRTDYRVVITGLPPTGSWQDLKDHLRQAGDIVYADVFRDCSGIVEFKRYSHMKKAVKEIDDTKFLSHKGETSYIRVKEERKHHRSSRSRSRSKSSRDRSRSYDSDKQERDSPTYSPNRKRSPHSRSSSDSR